MKINPQAANIAQQAYAKNSATNNKQEEVKDAPKESISLNVSSTKESLSANDLDSIKEQIKNVSNKLNVDYAQESANFDKSNITYFEGSFLTSQSSNIQQSAFRLLSE